MEKGSEFKQPSSQFEEILNSFNSRLNTLTTNIIAIDSKLNLFTNMNNNFDEELYKKEPTGIGVVNQLWINLDILQKCNSLLEKQIVALTGLVG
jgi:hypothetical protein